MEFLLLLTLASGSDLTCGDARDAYRATCCGATASTTFQAPCVPSASARVGGTLYVARTHNRSSWDAVHNLATAALDAGCHPASKPHMVIPHAASGLVAVSYTADSALHVLHRDTRAVVACVSTASFAGSKIHTAAWYEEEEENALALLLVDMTGEVGGHAAGGVHKYTVDAATGAATYVASVSTHTASRSATKPIAIGGTGNRFFVTDAHGGGAFLDARGAMTVVAQAPPSAFGRCVAGGGLWVVPHPTNASRVVAQYGRQVAAASCLVDLDLASATVTRVIDLPDDAVDAHGLQFCSADDRLYLLNSNRVSATFDVVDYATGSVVLASVALNGILNGMTVAYVDPPPGVSNVRLDGATVLFDHVGLVVVQNATAHVDGEGHFDVYVAPVGTTGVVSSAYKQGSAYASGAFALNATRWGGVDIEIVVTAMTNDHRFYSADGARTIVSASTATAVAPSPPPSPVPSPSPAGEGDNAMRRRLDGDSILASFDVLQPDVLTYADDAVYIVGRGPSPVSAVVPYNFVSSALPGLYTFALRECTRLYHGDLPPLLVDATRTIHDAPDPHGGYLVSFDEFWLVDQAASGRYAQCDGHAATYLDATALA